MSPTLRMIRTRTAGPARTAPVVTVVSVVSTRHRVAVMTACRGVGSSPGVISQRGRRAVSREKYSSLTPGAMTRDRAGTAPGMATPGQHRSDVLVAWRAMCCCGCVAAALRRPHPARIKNCDRIRAARRGPNE